MNVAYLTWGETPRSYGVFASQVIGQFVENYKISSKDDFYFISAVPIVHSGLVREKLKYFDELKKVKEKLGKIKFIWLPIYAIQNFVNSSKSTFGLMHGLAHWHLKNTLLRLNPDIVHCRSYHAAWAALQVKQKNNFEYKIIFDGRGLWPEEIALKREFSKDSEDYQFLKNIEKTLLSQCDATISVSDTMHQHYENIGVKRGELIYLSASVDKLAPSTFERNRENDTVTFCYVGALSEDTWHQPLQLLELYKHLRATVKKANLVIVTTSSHTKIKELFKEIPQNEVTYTSTKSIEELKLVLENVDFGLLSYFKPLSGEEQLLGRMVMAVKTAEYLAAGLPVMVNNTCGGAATVVEKYNAGVSYNQDTFNEITQETIQKLLEVNIPKNAVKVAEDLFDYKANAVRYVNLYENLLNDKVKQLIEL